MTEEIRSEINDFIKKFKGTYDLHTPYREFNFNWLEPFDKNLVESVKIEFDCVRNERIYGDGDYSEQVLNDFIVSLENLVKD